MKKSDAFGLLFSSDGKPNPSSHNARKSSARRTTLFTPSSLSAERNRGFPSASKSSSSRKTMSTAQNLINNKEFQQAATSKIRNYFRRQPEFYSFPLYGQQPLSTKGFIEMVDFLFNLLLKSKTLNHQNYLEKIPVCMKLLGYQGNLQKSWLQVVNTASAFPHVTALLVYLVDLIDWQDDSLTLDLLFPPSEAEEADEETNILKNCFAHELDALEKWNKCGEESASLTEEKDEMEKFTRKLIGELNIDQDDIMRVEKDIAVLESDLNEERYVYLLNEVEEAQNICSSLQKDEETMALDLKKMHEFVGSLEREVNEKDKKLQSHEQFLLKKKNEVLVLKQQCASQKFTVEDRQKMIKQCNELKDSIKCYEDYYKTVKETIFKDDITIAQLRQEVNNSCLAYNKLLMDSCNQFEEIKNVRLPPNVFQYDPESVNVVPTLRAILNECEVKTAELIAEIKSLESKNREMEGKLVSNFDEIKEREIEKTQLKEKLAIQNREMDELRKECIKNESELVAEICSMNKVLASCKEREEEVNNLKKLNEEKAVMIENVKKERQAILEEFTRQGLDILSVFFERCHEAIDTICKKKD